MPQIVLLFTFFIEIQTGRNGNLYTFIISLRHFGTICKLSESVVYCQNTTILIVVNYNSIALINFSKIIYSNTKNISTTILFFTSLTV